jgi:cellulose synthase/poly-beta-1,6-N-acetylglucosamine synthase-like glycosyltransferase
MKYSTIVIIRQPSVYPIFIVYDPVCKINIDMIFKTSNYPVVFLSYHEPNKEENFKRLLEVCPNAKRVDNIKGSDNAHKNVASLVKDLSTHVIIVDGDNYVKDDFLKVEINILDSTDINNHVISFSGYNVLNGNLYGNGGVKVWPIKLIENMATHENSVDPNSVDFDFKSYLQLNRSISDINIHSSPLQAWRSGFREGIKLCLENNKFVGKLSDINWKNYERLWRWMHLGADVENGIWAIMGARLGVYLSMVSPDYDIGIIRDFEKLNWLFSEEYEKYKTNPLEECNRLGTLIRNKANDTRILNVFSANDSKEYKQNVKPTLRSLETFIKYKYNPPYDVVFISYNEPNADENFELLKTFAPKAKRVDGVKGIHNAHIEAAKLTTSDYFWVVDGDAVIMPDFEFEYNIDFFQQPRVRVWRSKNPINELIYGFGGVKLLPRFLTLHMRTDKPDMTTSISDLYEPVFKLSNVTKFNTDPFSTWRSAFRECAKLSSQVIDRQESQETQERLDTWCTVGIDKPYGKYAIEGAIAGREYGTKFKGNLEELRKINDFVWLREQYDKLH